MWGADEAGLVPTANHLLVDDLLTINGYTDRDAEIGLTDFKPHRDQGE